MGDNVTKSTCCLEGQYKCYAYDSHREISLPLLLNPFPCELVLGSPFVLECRGIHITSNSGSSTEKIYAKVVEPAKPPKHPQSIKGKKNCLDVHFLAVWLQPTETTADREEERWRQARQAAC